MTRVRIVFLPAFAQTFQKEQVDPLQLRLQQVNGLGQGLIQSAGKNCDVQGLEHDMEGINTRWNTLNKKVRSSKLSGYYEYDGGDVYYKENFWGV